MSGYNFQIQLKFVSPTTGGIRWVGVDHEKKVFSQDYYRYRREWEPCVPSRLKTVRGVVNSCIRAGYQEV